MGAAPIMGHLLLSDTKECLPLYLIYNNFEGKIWEVSFAHAIKYHGVPGYYLH